MLPSGRGRRPPRPRPLAQDGSVEWMQMSRTSTHVGRLPARANEDVRGGERVPIAEPGIGVPVANSKPFVDFILTHLVGEVRIFNRRAALPDGTRPLVHLAAHGPLLGPTPAIAALARLYIDSGLGDMRIGFYPHRSFLWIPGIEGFLQRIGIPTRAYRLEDLVGLLRSGKLRVTGTALEGLHCHFSWKDPVGPFRSGGMIAAAILADASICLFTHAGGEAWNVRLDLPLGLTVPFTRGLRGVNIPIGPVRKIERYGLYCRRYRPALSRRALEKMDARGRRMALSLEMERIRNRLILMTVELGEKMRADSTRAG